MKKINKLQILKPYIIGFIFGLSFISGFTLASGTNGTIGDLFEKLDIGWVLKGDNIEDGTIDSSEIEDGTITTSDIKNGTIVGDDIANESITFGKKIAVSTKVLLNDDGESIFSEGINSTSLKLNSKKVATEEFVNSKGYITSSSLTNYATKDYAKYPDYTYYAIKSEDLPGAPHSFFAIRRCFDGEDDSPYTVGIAGGDCLRFACKKAGYDPNYGICIISDTEKNNQWRYNRDGTISKNNYDSNNNKTIRCKVIECRK